MKNVLVSVIIVNWNGRGIIDDCLSSLSSQSYKNLEILFVDNASTDNSVSFVKKKYPEIKIITNDTNLGYAGGHEVALKYISGEAILLLNTDTIFDKSLIEKLIKTLYSGKSIGLVQPKILMYPQKNLIDSIGAFFITTGDLYHIGREKSSDSALYNKQMDIFTAKGVCMLIKKEVISQTGLFDKSFFAYFEETDLCMRIWLAGYRVVYTPSAAIYHKGGGTSHKINWSYILFHSQKNRIATYLKNFSIHYLIRVLPVTILLYQCVFVLYFLTGKVDRALSIQKSLLWNLIHLGQTLRKRKVVQTKIRKIKDQQYLPRVTKRVAFNYYFYQFFGGIEKYKD